MLCARMHTDQEFNLIVEFYQTFKEKLYQYANMHHIIL